jgi:acetylornithine deacetylase
MMIVIVVVVDVVLVVVVVIIVTIVVVIVVEPLLSSFLVSPSAHHVMSNVDRATASAAAAAALESITLDRGEYIALLSHMIADAQTVQNNPPALIPHEDNIVRHVLDVLRPHTTEQGGPLRIQQVAFVPGRSNLIISYPGALVAADSQRPCVSFIGSHMDVVPAEPSKWLRDPFSLVVEGDALFGRGTTDCLGHVALLTIIFRKLAELRPALTLDVHACFIANEEAGGPGVGVDALYERGYLDMMRHGPVVWVDSADSQPCIGSASVLTWELTAHGVLSHSGFPQNGINAIEVVSDAVRALQERFHAEFGPHPDEERYKVCVGRLGDVPVAHAAARSSRRRVQ